MLFPWGVGDMGPTEETLTSTTELLFGEEVPGLFFNKEGGRRGARIKTMEPQNSRGGGEKYFPRKGTEMGKKL